MHAVLAAAIANPRFARPYGSDRGDNGFQEIGSMASDTYMRTNSCPGDYGDGYGPQRTIASGRARAIGTYGLN